MAPFVNLHVHTDASLLDGIIQVRHLVSKVKREGMDTIAITDHGNMANVIEFHQACSKEGIKGIIGEEFYLVDTHDLGSQQYRFHLVLLAKNLQGYRNLLLLTSMANRDGFFQKPQIDRKLLSKHKEGLICLSACLQGEVARLTLFNHYNSVGAQLDERDFPSSFMQSSLVKSHSSARDVVLFYQNLFGEDYFLEVMANGIPEQDIANQAALDLASSLGIVPVFTSDAHYLVPEDKIAHEVWLCNQTGALLSDPDRATWAKLPSNVKPQVKPRLSFRGDAFLWTPTLLASEEHHSRLAGLEGAIANTQLVADRCEQFSIDRVYSLPNFSTPLVSSQSQLSQKASSGLAKKFGGGPQNVPKEYHDQLLYELNVVEELGLADYFLTVVDYVDWSNAQGMLMGAGRGSSVSSLILYSLDVTKIDPIKYQLVFSRFLNSGRKGSLPDIDLDWGPPDRPKVVEYIRKRWGQDNACEICTFQEVKARQAVRDVTRILGLPVWVGDAISKHIPDPGRDKTPSFEGADKDPSWATFFSSLPQEHKQVVEIARKLEGAKKAISTHAGGVIISGDPLWSRAPLMRIIDKRTKKPKLITGYDMDHCEAVGLVKFDLLSVIAIQTVGAVLNSIRLHTGKEIAPYSIPLDDSMVWDTFRRGETEGVFQFDTADSQSAGTISSLAQKVGVTDLRELSDVVALFRPGTLDNDMDKIYLANKRNQKG
jgi:DNA polymerase-3 subunit alpha